MHRNLCFKRLMALALSVFLLGGFVAGCAPGAYITGGYRQVDVDLASSGVDYLDESYGTKTGYLQFLGQAWWRKYTTRITRDCGPFGDGPCQPKWVTDVSNRAAYYWVYLSVDANAPGPCGDPKAPVACKVTGGTQFIWNSIKGAYDEANRWGDLDLPGGYYQVIYESFAYNDEDGKWEDSTAVLYLVPASSPVGYTLKGGIEQARDEPSKQPYVTINFWGNVSSHKQLVATGKSWSKKYGWGFSATWLYLDP